MRANKKCLVIILGFLLALSITILADNNCPTKEEYRIMIKEATKDYLTNPTHEKLMNLQDMFKIYATHDFTKCLWKKTCNDGTLYKKCSATKPLYCDNGNLVNKCKTCGCKAGFECKADGSCALLACSDGTLYDKCSATKPLYCKNGNLINKCKACGCDADLKCEHDGSCVLPRCSDNTLHDQCSTNKPLFCQNGILINKCSVCKCDEDQVCKADETCADIEAKQAIPLILEADKLLAEKALETAKNTIIKYPEKYEQKVKQEIEKAKQLLAQANIESENDEYDKAINDYKKSWEHSQKAIKFANKEKPK